MRYTIPTLIINYGKELTKIDVEHRFKKKNF